MMPLLYSYDAAVLGALALSTVDCKQHAYGTHRFIRAGSGASSLVLLTPPVLTLECRQARLLYCRGLLLLVKPGSTFLARIL